MNLPKRKDVYRIKRDINWGTSAIVFDTELERKNEIGREYKENAIPFGQCYITQKQQTTGNHDGQIAFVRLPLTNLLSLAIKQYNTQANVHNQVPEDHEVLLVTVPCKVKYIKSFYGKLSSQEEVVAFESDRFMELVSHYLPDPLHSQEYSGFHEFLRHKHFTDQYSDYVVISLPKPRVSHYENPNFQIIRGKAAEYYMKIDDSLGFFPVNVNSGILHDLKKFTMSVMFLGLIFDLIVMLLIIISVLLIYSLLLQNVETKSFEIGVQRMVGLSKKGLIFMVIVQSCLFVLPAVLMGFAISFPCLNIFSYVMYQKLNLEVSPMLTQNAIAQALFIGIVIPLLSSIIPIRVALRKNLNDALDYQRSKVQAVFVDVL